MQIIIQHNSMVPIYEQITNKIKAEILAGQLAEGTALPSVRQLAKDLKISALTVKKAYDLLEEEGFTQTVHGKGSFVLAINADTKKEDLLFKTQEELEVTIKKAQQAGITNQEITEMIQLILEG